MPLAMLTGRGRLDLLRAVGLEPMPDRDVVLSDARNLDPREAELLAASAVTRSRLDRRGHRACCRPIGRSTSMSTWTS